MVALRLVGGGAGGEDTAPGGGGGEGGLDARSVLAVVVARMLLMPIIGTVTLHLVLAVGLMDRSKVDPLMLTVMAMMAFVPTANNALIMAQVAGAGAEAVALVIFWQYLVAPLFVSGWTALALATLWPKVVT